MLSLMVLVAAGCSTQVSRPYDAVEYKLVTDMSVSATHAIHRCDKVTGDEWQAWAQKLNHDSTTLVEFVYNKADREQVLPAARQIRVQVSEMLGKPSLSATYCRHKLSNIQAGSRILARALANADLDLCQGDVVKRYDLFAKSFKQGYVTKSEFEDLVSDLTRLAQIDQSGCTLKHRAELEQALELLKLLTIAL